MVADHSPLDNAVYFRILRRNSSSQYDEIYNDTTSYANDVTTNGNWFGALGGYSSGYHLFQLDSNNQITNGQTLPDTKSGLGYLLSDNTFVFINATTIRTYKISSGVWTAIQEISSQGVSFQLKSKFRVTSNTMAGISTNLQQTNGTIYYWTRNADLTWSLAGSIDFDDIHPAWALWNGDSALFVGDPGLGVLRIYSKNSTGEWAYENYPQNLLPSITGVGYFPAMMVLLNENTAVLSAPQDGYPQVDRVGAAVIMTRVNGVWTFTTLIKSDVSLYLFSAGLDANDYDIVFYSAVTPTTTAFYTLPYNTVVAPDGSNNSPNSDSNNPAASSGPSSSSGPNSTPSMTSGLSTLMPLYLIQLFAVVALIY